MLTRRRFLGYGAAGLVTAATGCTPKHLMLFREEPENTTTSAISLAERIEHAKFKERLLGYPANMNTPPDAFFAWRKQLRQAGIGIFAYNNVGNPFAHSPIPFNTHDFERQLIIDFGRLFAFPIDNIWGFLSHSGTDSNMHGMYMGRTLLKDRTGRLPKVYYTPEAHYSVQILRDLLGLEAVIVGTLPDGAMDPEDLARHVAEHADAPALVVATIGTTFKGAIDRVDDIQRVLQGIESYLHLDAALFGGYLPHTGFAGEVAFHSRAKPGAARYDSIAVSCHKFFGFPSPAGLFITSADNFNAFNALYSKVHSPEYIGHVPGTITCSRDAVKPAEFSFFAGVDAWAKQAEDANAMLRNTDYLTEQMRMHFPHLSPTRASAQSNTVYFRHPGAWLVEKYSLATMRLTVENETAEYAHVVVMPHARREILDEFLTDLESEQGVG
ncbi:MAG: pyridoxal-dependent decarboxylase [Gammaproteobacteria bacterium]